MTKLDAAVLHALKKECGAGRDYTKGGECAGCGECCSNFLPLARQEIRRIHALIRLRGLKENTRATCAHAHAYDATCPFLTKKNRCEIYAERPQVCRLFRCDYKKTGFSADALAKIVQARREIVSMREEFFGQRKTQRKRPTKPS
jgi:Fe-S-cluster containining protein